MRKVYEGGAREFPLVLDLALIHIDVPAAPGATPAIPAGSEQAVGRNRCTPRPDPKGGTVGCFQGAGECQSTGSSKWQGQKARNSLAIIESTVT